MGGGCFWCMESVFSSVRGVSKVTSGYAGGTTDDPDYQKVCDGDTGHAEVVKIEFDPGQISYEEMLRIFFATHDPTTRDRQGADHGSQYRSIILYMDEAQKRSALRLIEELDATGELPGSIVTEVEPLGTFYAAEIFHHKYYERNPGNIYCQMTIAPKLRKLKENLSSYLKLGD